ncbi:MAG: methyl-accepting chemotaxis protein [Pseudoalteromonas sp.]
MSLKFRFLATILGLVIGSLLILATATVVVSSNMAKTALKQAAREKLTLGAVSTKQAVDTYFRNMESQISIMSQQSVMIEKAGRFAQGFNSYLTQRGTISSSQISNVTKYYSDSFAALFAERNGKALKNASSFLAGLSDTALALQYDFISSSSYPIGNKDALTKLDNTSDYSQAHAKFHPDTRRFLQEYGYYDIFIVDASTGNIVYSVFKELDFATNLKTGPYANSGLGVAFRQALTIKKVGEVFNSKIEPYLPSYNAMAGFLSAPIFENDKKIAVLIFQIPLNKINNVLTRNKQWVEQGYGLSGETYLTNTDGTLLTESRFFLENENEYMDAISSKMPKAAALIKQAGTSVGYQQVKTFSSERALNGESGFEKILDYRDVEVFSAYVPINFGSNRFALMAEIDVEEALASATAIRKSILYAVLSVLIIVVIISVSIGYILVKRTIRPLEVVRKKCADLTSGDGNLTFRLRPCGINEIDELLMSFNVFIEQVHGIISNIKGDSISLASAAEELSAVTSESQKKAEEQRCQTQSVAAAIEELSASIVEISQTVVVNREQSESAKKGLRENLSKTDVATQNIRDLVKLIKESSSVIQSLQTDVNQVTKFLSVIASIADQTNLLALNAAIEAARAGETGRGFSVVADEVRALATRSQENTIEISKIVDQMTTSSEKSVKSMGVAVNAADQGIELVDTVKIALTDLAGALEQFQDLADIIASATEEQTAASSSVSASINQISEMAHDVENGAKQSTIAANELAKIATRSNEMVSRFKI